MSEWLGPDDERWRSTLRDTRHDVYHLPGYAELTAQTDGGTPGAYYSEIGAGRILIPLLVRSLNGVPGARADARDATSPYGYGGPVVTQGLSDADLQRAVQAFTEDGACYGLVTTFLRTHPLLRRFTAPGVSQHGVHVVSHGRTVSVDLTQQLDELDRHITAEYMRNIAKLRKAGFGVRFDAWDDYPEFQAAYRRTMQRLGADPRYHLDPAYFVQLRARLGSSLHLCSVVSPDGDLACGGLFTHVDGIVEYHLSATADRHLSMAPTKLMLFEARLWARERGGVVLHLGGGVGGKADSLYAFKRRFGSHEHVFETVRIIHDHQAYAELTDRWLTAQGQPSAPDQGFFPLYRSCVPAP